jgi:hypothetical protein
MSQGPLDETVTCLRGDANPPPTAASPLFRHSAKAQEEGYVAVLRRVFRRTVPFGLYCYTVTVVWYALHGHQPRDASDRRERAPWYTTKTYPSVSDCE